MSRAAKGADCKSAGYAFAGSSPASPTTLSLTRLFDRDVGARITGSQIVSSFWMKAASSSGVEPTVTAEMSVSFAFTPGSAMALLASAFSLAMTAGGVPAGARMPFQE